MITEADRTGFETTIELGPRDGSRYVAAAAVDANNEVLGSTVIYDMTTGKPAILSANIVSVEAPEEPPVEEPEPTPTPTPTPEPEPAMEEGSEEDDDEKEDGEGASNVSSFGAIGASVVAVAGIGSFALWFMRRRNKKNDIEASQYKPVRSED